MSTALGRTSRTSDSMAGKPSRGSHSPSIRPAVLKGWHGQPPATTSTSSGSRIATRMASDTSSLTTSAGSPAAFALAPERGSMSPAHRDRKPARRSPPAMPPAPTNGSTAVRPCAGGPGGARPPPAGSSSIGVPEGADGPAHDPAQRASPPGGLLAEPGDERRVDVDLEGGLPH